MRKKKKPKKKNMCLGKLEGRKLNSESNGLNKKELMLSLRKLAVRERMFCGEHAI